MQVRCGTTCKDVMRSSLCTQRRVRGRLVPPAPQVMDTNFGSNRASLSTVDRNCGAAPSSGGKNSNETSIPDPDT